MESKFSWPLCWVSIGLMWLAFVPSTMAMALLERNHALKVWLEHYSLHSFEQTQTFMEIMSVPFQAWISPEVVQPLGWLAYLTIGYWVVCLIKHLRADQNFRAKAPHSLLIFIAFMLAPVGSGIVGPVLVVILKDNAWWVSIPLSLGINFFYIFIFGRLGDGERRIDVLSLMLGLLTCLEFVSPSLGRRGISHMNSHDDAIVGMIQGVISYNNFTVAMLVIHAISLVVLASIISVVSRKWRVG